MSANSAKKQQSTNNIITIPTSDRATVNKDTIDLARTHRSLNFKFYLEHILHLIEDKQYPIPGNGMMVITRELLESVIKYDSEHKTDYYESIVELVDKDITEALTKYVSDTFHIINDKDDTILESGVDYKHKYQGWQFFIIKHNRDTKHIKNSAERKRIKTHYQGIVRPPNSTYGMTQLNALPCRFDFEKDMSMIQNKGIEVTGDFGASVLYLTHETPKAKDDGKYIYSRDEVISNVKREYIDEIRERQLELDSRKKKYNLALGDKFDPLEVQAYNLGTEFGDFERWWYREALLTPRDRAKVSLRDLCRAQYTLGEDEQLSKKISLHRRSIYVYGAPECGKSFQTNFLMKYRYGSNDVISIDGGGTGKFDNVKGHHKAILLNDDTMKEAIIVADEYPCRAYKRGKNNPVLNNDYLIVTFNDPFLKWVEALGYKDLAAPIYTGMNEKRQLLDELNIKGNLLKQRHAVQAVGTRFAIVRAAYDYVRDKDGKIILINYSYGSNLDGTARIHAQAIKCYTFTKLKDIERGVGVAREFKAKEVDEYIYNMNALAIRRAEKREVIDLDVNSEIISSNIIGNELNFEKFKVIEHDEIDSFIDDYYYLDEEMLEAFDKEVADSLRIAKERAELLNQKAKSDNT